MPFVLPSSMLSSDELILVLSYGRLSMLEACTVLGNSVSRAEAPSERIGVLKVGPPANARIPELAGIHKAAPLMLSTREEGPGPEKLVELLSGQLEEKSKLSLSGYDLDDGEYDDLVGSLLDGVRAIGLRKVRLLRPKDDELLAEQVLSREALDVVAFPYHGGIGLGPTTWVPDSASMRRRGTRRPMPHPDITLSPRLAHVLLNLADLRPGQTVLDPFCGSGTILSEALVGHLNCLGLDRNERLVQDARENLRWLGRGTRDGAYDVRKGDARELQRTLRGTKVDAVVTEPLLMPRLEARPRTSTAEEMVNQAAVVYSQALASMANSIRPGGRIVVVVPIITTMDGEEVVLTLEGRKLGLNLFQPGPTGFEYPVRLSFETTRWVKRGVYVFESRS